MTSHLKVGRNPIKLRLCPDMTIAVGWDINRQIKLNKQIFITHYGHI